MSKEIKRTETEEKDGITYVTHYVDRPIKQGYVMVAPSGTIKNGVSKTTKIEKYIYKSTI